MQNMQTRSQGWFPSLTVYVLALFSRVIGRILVSFTGIPKITERTNLGEKKQRVQFCYIKFEMLLIHAI